MSKSSITRSITVLFVLIASIALVTADLILVSAQNTNSSTTQSDEQTRGGTMTSQNTNASSTGGQRRGRRRRRTTRRNTNMSGDMAGNANMGDMAGNANTADDTQNTNMTGDTSGNTNMSGDMSGTTGGRRRRGRRRAVRLEETSGYMQNQELERTSGRQEDLAGQSYTGTVNYSEGSLSGPATLSFESGNQFTLTPEGGTAMSGRYSAVTTRGYTGVTMMFTGATPATIVSVRLKKMGNGVSIMSVPGESRQFSFTSSGGGGGGGRYTGSGGRRRRRVRRGRRYQRPRGAATTGIKPPMGQPGGEPEPTPTP